MKKMLSFLLAFGMVCSSFAISAHAEEAAALPEQVDRSAQATEPVTAEENSADELLEAAAEAETVVEPAPEVAPEAETVPETEAEVVPEVQVEATETAPELEPETVAEAQPEETAVPEEVGLDTYEAASNGFVYTTSGTNATITAYTGTAASVTIPEKLGGCTVTGIGMNAFAGHSEIKTLVIPKTVSSYGIQAFMNCTGLADVTINSTELKVSDRVFQNTGAMKVTFGEGVRKIPMQMFTGGNRVDNTYCHIVSLKLPSTLLEIDYAAFSGCYDLKEVDWGNGIETVGRHSFKNTALESVVLPDSVTFIDYYAFADIPSLKKLVIPKNVETIGNCAFVNCTGLTDVTINAAQMSVGTTVFMNTGAMKVTFGEGVRAIPSALFTSTSSKVDNKYCHIVSAKMSSTVQKVGSRAFAGCYDLKEVVWGSDVKTIEGSAFDSTCLESVVLPEKVETIGTLAFANNAALKTLVIPKSVTNLGEQTFGSCTGLTDVTINAPLLGGGYHAFANTGAFKAVFGEGVTKITKGLFSSSSSKADNKYCHIVSAEIPSSVVEIETDAFTNCYDLTKVTVKSTNAAYATYTPFNNVPTALTFYCYKSSTTDSFAQKNNFKVVYLETPEDAGIKGFVNRLYSVCLGRNPDAAGQADWVNQLKSYRISGTSAAKGFIFSKEFTNKNYNNSDYVEYLYQAFMGRASDAAGKKGWVSKLDSNQMTREQVFYGFADSVEFDKICNSYGIVSKDIETFVTRLYSVCLDRKPDNGGLTDWSAKLRGKTETGRSVAHGFVFSKEFQNKKYSNEDFVEHLYAAFMGRASDAAGKADWVAKLNNGTTREQVFDGFVGSQEFTAICAGYGINRG